MGFKNKLFLETLLFKLNKKKHQCTEIIEAICLLYNVSIF